jgi:hypothetical protein
VHRIGRVRGHRTWPVRARRETAVRSGRPLAADIAPDEAVRDAAASCPVEAISLVDADTGQQVDLD